MSRAGRPLACCAPGDGGSCGPPLRRPSRLAGGAARAVVALAAACALAACASPPGAAPSDGSAAAPGNGYLCCNLRTDGSWLSDANYQEQGKLLVAAGTPLRVLGYGRQSVVVELQGRRQEIGNDYSRSLALGDFARRWVVADDPRRRLAFWPQKTQDAIRSARVSIGMSREQVLMAIGYPIADETPHLDAPAWKYWLWTLQPFTVRFQDGFVTAVDGKPEVLERVFLR